MGKRYLKKEMLYSKIAKFNTKFATTMEITCSYQKGHGYTLIMGPNIIKGFLYDGLTLKGAMCVVDMAIDMTQLRDEEHKAAIAGDAEYWKDVADIRGKVADEVRARNAELQKVVNLRSDVGYPVHYSTFLSAVLMDKDDRYCREKAVGWGVLIAKSLMSHDKRKFLDIYPFDTELFKRLYMLSFNDALHQLTDGEANILMDILASRYVTQIRIALLLDSE